MIPPELTNKIKAAPLTTLLKEAKRLEHTLRIAHIKSVDTRNTRHSVRVLAALRAEISKRRG